MTTATRTRKQETRIARLMYLGTTPTLGLTSGKDTTFYKLTTLDHGFGEAAFRLEKAERGGVEGEKYDVLLDGQRSTCECKGFLRWHHCKHIEALEELIKAGKLATRRVEKEEPQPELCSLCKARKVHEDGLCYDCLYPF